jgi:hypothetical protein
VLLNAFERRILLNHQARTAAETNASTSTTLTFDYYYTDIDLGGLYCVRGENMVLLGRHNDSSSDDSPSRGVQLELTDFQAKYQEQKKEAATIGRTNVQTEWDFDSDLIA